LPKFSRQSWDKARSDDLHRSKMKNLGRPQ
jgi:hypothetical protein